MNSEIFIKENPTKLFFKCAIPAVITSVFGALYSVVDGVFVGRYLGENALAAINLMMPIIMIVEAVANMIATGASVNISLFLGKKERKEASKVFSSSVRLILAFSCIIGILGFFFARPFVLLISPNASSEAVELSIKYLKVYSAFAPLIPIYFATDNYLRVCGKHKFSMEVNVGTQLLNVVLDFLFVVVFHMGVTSVAIASCLSIVFGSLITLISFTNRRMDIYYVKERIAIRQFVGIIANGSSEFFSTIAASVMSIVMNLFLLKYGGTTAVAAFSILMYVDSIIGMMNFGICDSLQPAISYCYGAGNVRRMKEIFMRVLMSTIIVSIISFLFMLLAGPFVAPLFIKESDTHLLDVSIVAIKIFSFSYFVGWTDMCFSSYFTALDKYGRSLIVSIFGTLVFPIIFLVILSSLFGLNGVWLTASASGTASGILTIILYKTMKL